MKKYHKAKGFTLAELIISVSVLALIAAMSTSVYLNFFGSVRNLKAANSVYEEARFVMERIVKEIRNGTIDYEEYYNQNLFRTRLPGSYEYVRNESYAQDYCQYSLQFYDAGYDNQIGTFDDKSTGERNASSLPAVGRVDGLDKVPDPIQDDLFLININGDRRSYIKRIEKTDGVNTIGRIGLLKMTGEDFGVDHISAFDRNLDGTPDSDCITDPGEGDGRIDTWLCEDGYGCENADVVSSANCGWLPAVAGHKIVYDPTSPADNNFVDITPSLLDIVDLKFIITPMDDPRKAYKTNEVQVQPHITIKMTARANPRLAMEFTSGNTPTIVLESTVSARAYNEIITECNLKLCDDVLSDPKPCPLLYGVCAGLTQTCNQYMWSGCSDDDYGTYAEANFGLGFSDYLWGDNNLANDNGPVGSDFHIYQAGSEISSCPADTPDTCEEEFCSDGYDNDCNGFKDEDDPNCVFYFCNNGSEDDVETCIDVGGVCESLRPLEAEETRCYDGYDNDCDGYADEFDAGCVYQLCTNGIQDPDPVIEEFLLDGGSPINYLIGREDYDVGKSESCIDIGGICDLCKTPNGNGSCTCGGGGCTLNRIIIASASAANEIGYCSDGLDNDCDGGADELDPDCTADICTNGIRDCDLAPPDYSVPGYLVDYVDRDTPLCSTPAFPNRNDEACIDVGGVCDNYWEAGIRADHTYFAGNEAGNLGPATAVDLCTDELDNDCDEDVDWEDDNCCTDGDGDTFLDDDPAKCDPPGYILTDCDDGDIDVFPGAVENCVDGIDNDCDGDTDGDDSDCV